MIVGDTDIRWYEQPGDVAAGVPGSISLKVNFASSLGIPPVAVTVRANETQNPRVTLLLLSERISLMADKDEMLRVDPVMRMKG